MRPLHRFGLLGATLALPIGTALVSHVLGENPTPPAPVEVRIGEPDQPPDSSEKPKPSPETSKPEPETPVRPRVEPQQAQPPPDIVVPPAPPVVEETGSAKDNNGKDKSKGKPGNGNRPASPEGVGSGRP